MPVLPTVLHALIGCSPTSKELEEGLTQGEEPETIKAYSDIVYYNYTSRGFSLQFTPSSAYKPPRTAGKRSDLEEKSLTLSTIDIYTKDYKGFPIPLTYTPPPQDKDTEVLPTESCVDLRADTTGYELVKTLGEPDRKGGGESRSVGVWMEWTGLGLMVEFSGVHGHQKWDKEHGAGGSIVSVWSLFEPGKSVGQEDDDDA